MNKVTDKGNLTDMDEGREGKRVINHGTKCLNIDGNIEKELESGVKQKIQL